MNEEEKALAIELAEVGLDLVLDEGLLKEIPFLGTLYVLTKTLSTVRDRLFATKVKRFLIKAAEIGEEERANLESEIRSNPRQKAILSEIILLSLDQADRLKKADLLALVFRAYLKREIASDEFDQLSHAINRCDLLVLLRLIETIEADSNKNPKTMRIGFESLIAAGLTRGTGTMSPNSSGTFTRPTELGLKLYEIIKHEMRV
jgi:hypothetical protein